MNALLLGFSVGCFPKELGLQTVLEQMQNLGAKAVELKRLIQPDSRESAINKIRPEDLASFRYVSYHAPNIPIGKNEATAFFFRELTALQRIRPIDLLIVHPDRVENLSVLDNLPSPVGFENMDNRKKSNRIVADMEETLAKNAAWKLVLDVNHCFTNDPSMKLASDFYDALGTRIAQVHVSGFRELHDPLFETRQDFIVSAIRDTSVPIIIESRISPENIHHEYEYVSDILKKA